MNVKNEHLTNQTSGPPMAALVWLLLGVLGAAGLWLASGWPMGQIGRPGPGVFAAIVLILLTGLAGFRLANCLRAVATDKPATDQSLSDQSVWALLVSPGVFAVLVEPAGFVVASLICAGLVAVTAGARPFRAVVISVVLAAVVFLLFRFGLSVPLDWRGSWMR